MTIAIIGCGASCVIILHEILQEIDKFRSVNIVIYEKNTPDGKGIAYSVVDESFILNTSPKSMSVNSANEHDYIEWCKRNGKNKILRVTYGEYLSYSLKEAMNALILHNVNVVIKKELICSIDFEHHNVIIKTDRAIFHADFCIIASGGNVYKPYEHLHTCPRYIGSINQLEGFIIKDKQAAIGIIGTNQSAVDAALYLKDKAHKGLIYMFSNKGLLPKVKQREADVKPITNSKLHKLIVVERQFKLNKLIAAFEADMKAVWESKSVDNQIELLDNLDWRIFFHDIRQAKSSQLVWQKLMEQLTPFIHDIWVSMSPEERRYFFKNYYPYIIRLRGAIPMYNGEKIFKLLQTNQIKIIRGVTDIKDSGNFIITDGNKMQHQVRYLINAAGIHKKEPIKHTQLLEKKGLAVASENGGIEVDLRTNQLLTKYGNKLANIYAIGYPTCGTFLFINSIELLRVHAHKITAQLISQLQSAQVGTSVLM